jgi:hypothetical protein
MLIPQRGGRKRVLAQLDLLVGIWLGAMGPLPARTPGLYKQRTTESVAARALLLGR